MKIIESFLTNNLCYKENIRKIDSRYTLFQRRGFQGIMLHSVGCPQSKASVFISNWNKASYDSACVHGFIDAVDGNVYQTLPWNYRGWHCGGVANNTHIGIEMCEPDCIEYIHGSTFACSNKAKATEMVKRTYISAVLLCAQLCKKYKLNPLEDGVIISHKEGAKRGIASGHADPEHLWQGLGFDYTMDTFRRDVNVAMNKDVSMLETQKIYRVRKSWKDTSSQIGAFAILENAKAACKEGYSVYDEEGKSVYTIKARSLYKVKITASELNVRAGAGTRYKVKTTIKKNEVYTIVEEENGWGRLKSGVGWICLKYTVKV